MSAERRFRAAALAIAWAALAACGPPSPFDAVEAQRESREAFHAGDLRSALAHQQRALEIAERAWSSESRIRPYRDELVPLQALLGMLEEVEPEYRAQVEAAPGESGTGGWWPPLARIAAHNLAILYHQRGRSGEAWHLLQVTIPRPVRDVFEGRATAPPHRGGMAEYGGVAAQAGGGSGPAGFVVELDWVIPVLAHLDGLATAAGWPERAEAANGQLVALLRGDVARGSRFPEVLLDYLTAYARRIRQGGRSSAAAAVEGVVADLRAHEQSLPVEASETVAAGVPCLPFRWEPPAACLLTIYGRAPTSPGGLAP